MPFNPDQHRATLTNARLERAGAETQLHANDAQLRSLEADLNARIRAGASSAEIAEVQRAIDTAREVRQQLLGHIRDLDTHITDVTGGVIVDLKPETLFTALDGRTPLALLPARLETRFFDSARELHIRIYPDQIHVDTHIPELTPAEIELGQWYWGVRAGGDADQTRGAWLELGRRMDAPRAAWVVRSLTPTNIAEDGTLPPGTVPAFPDVEQRPNGSARAPRATLLPDRWVAIGYRRVGVSYQPIFRQWGRPVPDALNVGPSFERLGEISASEDEPPIEPEMRWMFDYDAALAAGMAITVRDEQLSGGNRLANGIDLLVVFGIDWTLTEEQGAANLSALFQSHLYGDGLAFVPQGTPTNNTADTRSGFTSDAVAQANALDPSQSPQVDPQHGASVRLAAALALPDGGADLSRAPNAGLAEQHTASLLVDALWQSTLGYYLDTLLDPFATDTMVDLARDHAAHYLQPFGPYAALRIGSQPYGVLPVVAMDLFKEDRPKGVEAALYRFLLVARWYWQDGIRDLPYMGRSGDPDDDLLKLLQLTPVATSARYRRALDTETVSNTDGLKRLAMVQSDILRSLILPQFASFAGPLFNVARITQLALYPTHTSLTAPWVQPGELVPGAPLERNYVTEIAALARAGTSGQSDLNARSRSTYALLEMLLALAALTETKVSGDRTIHDHLVAQGVLDATLERSSMRVASTLGVYKTAEESAAGQMYIQTPEQQAKAIIPALTGSDTVLDFVIKQVVVAPEKPSVRNLATFLASLDGLATRPVDEIDRAFRALLDCYSHRLDAWFTSLASRRMEAARASRPAGLHVGGYGWVENLRPDRSPDSLGYVHAPSLSHASTAALLRSGHLSHRNSEGEALNIDLSSARVRQGLSLIEGVAQGQPLSALLGYRFERGLRDRGITLARFILPFRKIAPLRPTVPDTTSEPSESIAARDVVDGVALLARWRAEGAALIDEVNALGPTVTERGAIESEFIHLEDLMDSVSDIMTAESVYQTVQGNYERAGAALAAFDRQSRPPDPQVVRTPRSGMMFTQRVLLVLQDAALPAGWGGVRTDLRAQIEPRLNAWIGARLGDPRRFVLSANVWEQTVDDDGTEHEALAETLTATLDELDLSPLSVVLTSVATQAERPSELEVRLAHVFAGKIAAPGPTKTLELLDDPPADADDTVCGLGELRALAQMIHTFVANRRALDAHDFYPPEGEPPTGVDLVDLQTRLDTHALPALDAAITGLSGAIAAPAPGTLRAALSAAADLGKADAVPDALLDDDDSTAALLAQAGSILQVLLAVQEHVEDMIADFTPPDPADERYPVRLTEFYVACLRAILGDVFPVLPLFAPVNGGELAASRADQSALTGGDPFAAITWLQQAATVRPDVDALVSVLTAAELLGTGPAPADYAVMQLPHVPGQTWAGLTLPDGSPLLAVVTVGGYDLAQPVAGLICDGWSEMIPASVETTGLTFHYDAPAARPPQAILLAAPPDLNQPNWTFEAVAATIMEAFDLAKLRLVDAGQIRALGGMLPAIYLPQDPSFQVPSVDLNPLLEAYKAGMTMKITGKMFTDASE
ncbi:hypothetical protein [Aggregatilinea lenta]|uniref:hypothetical protein n=1 Tax=Aggregatilinea lenta TaxID=913108 RepID=UPI000E5BE0F8|nr:hypothetical protein [Aggregatilinea lenta]